MVNYNGVLIKEVEPDSIGAELELEPGDHLIRINNIKLLDFIDYLMLSSEGQLNLEVLKPSGEIWEVELEKDPDEPLGLVFETLIFDGLRACNNHCLFCFVHQLPTNQRATLYIQDDDYRFSFLQGSYITLTNLTEHDWRRIEKLHLSPLYISVHATNPKIRQKLLGSKLAGRILEQLERLAKANITVHTQAVICPGLNDGPVLEETITDLAKLWPAVASLAVVPVGLTGHRHQLFQLRTFQADEAKEVLEIVKRYQSKYLQEIGTRFVFAADEWYIMADQQPPSDEEYEDYPQLDNGVGLIRWFLTEFNEYFQSLLPELQRLRVKFIIVTGESAWGLWREIQEIFKQSCPGIELTILPVKNEFLGSTVTVTGLLGGKDIGRIIQQQPEKPEKLSSPPDLDKIYLIPQITLKQDENIFLDGLMVDELKKICFPQQIEIVPTRAKDWLTWMIEKGSVAGWRVQ